MLKKDCFEHRCPGEPPLGKRIKQTGYTKGAKTYFYAESLGYHKSPKRAIRKLLHRVAFEAGTVLVVPPPELCTDNGAMIAWAGIERLRLGMIDGLDAPGRPRWPLDPKSERSLINKA